MQICVIIDSYQYILLTLKSTDRVLYLKAKIDELMGIPYNQQQIVFQGKVLDNDNTLDYYSIQDDSALHLTTQSESCNSETNDPKFQIFINGLVSIQFKCHNYYF